MLATSEVAFTVSDNERLEKSEVPVITKAG
jgi:hypothetical protein